MTALRFADQIRRDRVHSEHQSRPTPCRIEVAPASLTIFRTIGRPELVVDPRFCTNHGRVTNRDALDALIGCFIAERTQAENLSLFEAAQVTVGPVCSVSELLDHPYTAGREAIVSMADDDVGELPMHNVVPRLSRTPGVMRRPSPRVGEHTAEVLAEIGLPVGKTSDSMGLHH